MGSAATRVSRSHTRKPPIAYATLVGSAVAHIVTGFLFVTSAEVVRIVDLRYHVGVLGALSLCLSVAIFIVRRNDIFLVLSILRLAVVVILGVRFPGFVALRVTLLLSLAVELAVYQRYPTNAFLGTAASLIAAFLFLLADGLVPDRLSHAAFIVLTVGGVAWIASAMGDFREQLVGEREHGRKLDQIIQELSASNLRLQQLAFRAEEESKESERNRITSEIHDAVGYTLTNLIMMMEAATDIAQDDPVRLARLMQDARDQAKSGLEDTRRALRKLRAQPDFAPRGVQACERLFQTFEQASSVAIHAEYGNIPISFGDDVDAVVYRFLQEGLTNAVRHGRSSLVDVVFWLDGLRLSITMTDNGVGASHVEPGIGITAMRERADRFGGTVRARSVPHGFELRMELSLPERANG